MKIHILQYNPLSIEMWMEESKIRYAAHHGGGWNKTIDVTLSGKWIVTDHNMVKYDGSDPETAIHIYNSITKRG